MFDLSVAVYESTQYSVNLDVSLKASYRWSTASYKTSYCCLVQPFNP